MKLLEHFKELSLHPKNAEELKGLILQLAVQGKLTAKWREAHPKVEPASELLKRIEAEKQQLIAEKKIRKEKPFPPIEDDEIPYELPEGWIWCRMSEIGIINPRNTLADDLDVGFVPMKSISQNYSVPPEFEIRKWKDVKRNFTHFKNNDVAFAKITPCFENSKACVFSALPNGYGAGTTELHVFRKINNDIYPSFIYSVFKSPHFLEQGEGKMTGTAGQKRVPKNYFSEYVVGVPPLEEQKAIVEVVKTLFAEVEQLESLTKERIQLKESFVVSALARLMEAENTQEEWNFLQQHFSSFFTEKKNIKSLRETILQLAVQGKLTEVWRANNLNIEPASELLKRIDVEIKKRRSVPSNTEVPDSILNMVIVDSWCTKTIANLLEIGAILDLKDGNHGNNHPVKADFTEKGLPFITAAQVLTNNRIDYDGAYKLAGKPLAKIKIGHAIKDDVIFTHKGSIGRVAIADRDCILTPQTTYYRLNQMVFDKTYIMYCLLSPLYKIQYDLVKKQSTRDYVSLKKQYLFAIPIPPLKEQQAIVEKVNSLMTLCDELEQQIESSHSQVEQLMQSCLQEVFEHESN